MDANKTLIKTATDLLKIPSRTLISVLFASMSGFNCGKTMEGQNDTKYDSTSFCPSIVLPIPNTFASPRLLRLCVNFFPTHNPIQRREGFLNCLTAWASPRALCGSTTCGEMPSLMKIIATQQIGQAAPWQTAQTGML
ncbi:hypothetical protein LF1_23230 [Rubripirellula obstinata]|uniref:Uncharacterized protein n=1 Tax=Rubripirellula obstinata TaxID=406547 RepID=A0A5B1CGV5_9BACT|nr:hypothetical protein LF1_23230 [Rubripirellula obstinata]